MDNLKVIVTAEDIAEWVGTVNSGRVILGFVGEQCAVAKAVRRLPGFENGWVVNYYEIRGSYRNISNRYKTSSDIEPYIREMDSGETVEPFEFELIPD